MSRERKECMLLEKFLKTYITQVSSVWLYILILTVVFWGLMEYLEKQGAIRRHSSTLKAVLSRSFLAVSLAGILALTLCGREPGGGSQIHFRLLPFWSYWKTFTQQDVELGIQIVNNVLLFIPLGFTLPLNFLCLEKVRHTILAATMLSLTVELIQGVTGLGLCEIDDVIGNTLGAGIGACLWKYKNQGANYYT